MFYKRISDLHPLGKKLGDSWDNVTPIQIPEPGYYYDTTIDNKTVRPITRTTLPTNITSETHFDALDDAFNNAEVWYGTTPTAYSYRHAGVSDTPIPESVGNVRDSEYYAKSLWFEVAVTKDNQGKPVSQPVAKIQSKRVNAYLLFTNIDEISAKEISADLLSAKTIITKEVSTQVVNSGMISTEVINARYGDIDSLNASSITANGVSSSVGVVNDISGDNLYYNNARFTNITVDGVAELTATAAYWADVAEIYTADKGYLYGTLVKFGGDKEITIADDKANAVVSENPAITLNSGNKEEYATPIVLTGRSMVRMIHPVERFDKIYLSEVPGVGAISSYKISSATMPLGIALESKPYEEEGLVECILQVNFE